MKNALLVIFLVVCTLSFSAPLHAQTQVTTTTTDGTISGTSITYTITATGTAREIFAPGNSDGNAWSWTNGFPEYVATNFQSLSVSFSDPVPINRIVLGVNSIVTGHIFTLTLNGGTASTADFDLTDGLAAVGGTAPATYTSATGQFTATGADQSLMIGSTSSNTITGFSLSGDDGGDGYTLFFGTAAAPITTPIPTIGEWGMIILSMLTLITGTLIMRRRGILATQKM